jgi:hypothetical protein
MFDKQVSPNQFASAFQIKNKFVPLPLFNFSLHTTMPPTPTTTNALNAFQMHFSISFAPLSDCSLHTAVAPSSAIQPTLQSTCNTPTSFSIMLFHH